MYNEEITKAKSKELLENWGKQNPEFAKTIEILDSYDFSKFLVAEMNLPTIVERIECCYDNDCFEKYGRYLFDGLIPRDIILYFESRYPVRFTEYIDYICRKGDK